MGSLSKQLRDDGYAIVRNVIEAGLVQDLCATIEQARSPDNPDAVCNASGVDGFRNLLDVVPEVSQLCELPSMK